MKRTPAEQVALAVRILSSRHFQDVYDRAIAEMGDRGAELGPIDLTRNTLRAYVERINRAHETPGLVSGLARDLAMLVGDQSASTLVAKYEAADGSPVPTALAAAATEAHAFQHGAGYGGLQLVWSERSQRFALKVIAPDDLEPEFHSDDPTEPTIIKHSACRVVEGEELDVLEVYDLTDLEAPSYKVWRGDEDITAQVHGEEYTGDSYWWRYSDGTPFHPIVITGDTRHPYRTNGLIEATLKVCVFWTHFGAGLRDAGHPQRHVVGMEVFGLDSDAEGGQVGQQHGPETVVRWQHTDRDRPGEHWQDEPGFDPEVTGRAIRMYELLVLSAYGLPVDYERTGGEPTEQERMALERLIATTFPEARRFVSEVLRRCAAMANRLDAVEGTDFNEAPYGVLLRDEVAEAVATAAEPPADPEEEDEDDGGRDEPRQPGEDPDGEDPEDG